MILVVDNYDSFTFNLVHYLMELGADVRVERNDALSAAEALRTNAKGFLISPGPCTPNEAGISLDLVAACADAGRPLLGVCLGHQAIGQYFGGRVVRGGLMGGLDDLYQQLILDHYRNRRGRGRIEGASASVHVPWPIRRPKPGYARAPPSTTARSSAIAPG